jgi:hypothetical protein
MNLIYVYVLLAVFAGCATVSPPPVKTSVSSEEQCTTGGCASTSSSSLRDLCYQDRLPEACFNYGQLLEKEKEDLSLVIQVYREGCDDGEKRACDAISRLQRKK